MIITMPPQHDFTFHADWESCDAKVTYRPKWKSLGSTPKTLKLSPGRSYRVSVRAETTPTEFAEILQSVPWSNIRTIRIPHGGPIATTELGKELGKLNGVETVGMSWPYDSISWFVNIRQAGGLNTQFELEKWPVAEVTTALGQVRRAKALNIRMDDFKDNFSLSLLFNIQGLESVYVDHRSHCEQELDWTGLSRQTKLCKLQVRNGFLAETFWSELGKLKRIREIEMWWPAKAKAAPGDLVRLTSLKKLNGVCLFNYVPEAFQAFAQCSALEAVKIDQCRLDDASTAGIGTMPHVKDCHIWNTEMSDAGMQSLCRWPRIKSLVLCENSSNPTPITHVGFEALGNLKSLEFLHLQGFEAVAAAGWAVLQRLPRLKRLKLMSRPTFDLLDAIGPLPGLTQLSLSMCNSVGSVGLQQLKAMPRLRTLNINLNHYSPYYVPVDEVSELRQLTTLSLASVHKMNDDQLGQLADLKNLQELYLHEAVKISDQGIANLASLRNIRLLSLTMMPKLTDRTIITLAAFPRLETLFLRCTGKITDKGLADLAAARSLTTLHLDFARNLTGECLLDLVRRLPLKELWVKSSPALTDEHLLKLAEHPTLKSFGISGCKNVTNEGRKALTEARPDWESPTFPYWYTL